MATAIQLPPAVSLLLAARQRLAAPGDHLLALIELATSAALVVAIARSLRGREDPRGVSAVDLAAGLMLAAEWWDATSHGHRWFSPTLLSAAVALVIGVLPLWFPHWKTRRRVMRVDAEGVRYRRSALRRFETRWRDVRSVIDRGDAIELERVAGAPQSIRLSALVDPQVVREALLGGAARAGVPVRTIAVPTVAAAVP